MLLQKATRGLSFITVLGFTYALLRLISAPGRTQSRLLFFGLLLGLAYVGLAGLVLGTPSATIICAVVLLVIGFTQFVLFIYVFPTGLILLVDGISSAVPRPVEETVENSPEDMS